MKIERETSSTSVTEACLPESHGLTGCYLNRPDSYQGKVEIAIARPSPRSFPARLNTNLGLCLKLGEAHQIESNGVKMLYPANALCIRSPGIVWSSELAAVGFISIDIDPEYLDFEVPEEHIQFIPGTDFDLRKTVAFFEPGRTRLEQDEVLFEIIEWCYTRYFLQNRSQNSSSRESASIKRTCRFLEENLLVNPSLDELAALVGHNKFTFLRQFKQAKGITPHHYAISIRIAKARELLARGISASEVAFAVGFSDQAHLNRHFLKVVGMTPGRYAREKRSIVFQEYSIF